MNKILNINDYKNIVYSLVGNEYTVLSEHYVDSSTKLEMIHNYCGHKFKVTPNKFLNVGTRCPICSRHSFTPKSYAKWVLSNTKGKIKVLDDYIDFNTPLHYQCLKHNYVFYRSPISFRRSTYKCKMCKYDHISKKQRKSNILFLHELSNRHPNIVALEKYKSTHKKIKFKCLKCNHCFCAEPNSILRISGCPYCRASHGEEIIGSFLDKMKIKYEYAKRFPQCKGKRLLHYDFFLPDIRTLIEYDGLQHYKSIEFFGGKEKLKVQQKHDQIKNDYALNNGFLLYRIPYTNSDRKLRNIIFNICNTKGYTQYLITEGNAHKPRYLV